MPLYLFGLPHKVSHTSGDSSKKIIKTILWKIQTLQMKIWYLKPKMTYIWFWSTKYSSVVSWNEYWLLELKMLSYLCLTRLIKMKLKTDIPLQNVVFLELVITLQKILSKESLLLKSNANIAGFILLYLTAPYNPHYFLPYARLSSY